MARSPMDETAARGFAGAVAAYERGRPAYPEAAISCLVEALRLEPEGTVLDLAAGTGKLTRRLVGAGARVDAVEPVDEMRAVHEAALPEVEALAGTAESIPLADGAVGAVTVGQAFHWFDGDRALAELHRVLRPEGRLGLIWNWRDQDSELQAGLSELIEPYRGETTSYSSGRWREAFERTSLFTALAVRSVPWVHETTPDGVVDRFASVSFISTLSSEEKERLFERIRALLGGRERVELAYRTDVYWCERVDARRSSVVRP